MNKIYKRLGLNSEYEKSFNNNKAYEQVLLSEIISKNKKPIFLVPIILACDNFMNTLIGLFRIINGEPFSVSDGYIDIFVAFLFIIVLLVALNVSNPFAYKYSLYVAVATKIISRCIKQGVAYFFLDQKR